MKTLLRDERGSAMVMALVFITGLALTASVIVYIATAEKRVTLNQYSHARSFYASDAGSEQAINWLRVQPTPPGVVEVEPETLNRMVLSDHAATLSHDQEFELDIRQKLGASGNPEARPRPGWDESWRDFDYVIDSFGNSVNKSNSRIEVHAARLFRVDYAY